MEDIYFDENVQKFVDILFERDFVVLLSLVESLDSQENKNNADEVAQTLLDFLTSNKRILPVLNSLISKEIEFVDNPTTLFRRNSVCSKMLSRFTKVNGQEFLDSILKQLIEDLNKKDKGQYEVDTKKVDPKDVESNSSNLKMLLEEFIVEVLNSLDFCPLSLKVICNHLRGATTEKFGEKMGRSSIGGYIFLRFVCPAMVAPDQFGINSNITAFAKRTLIIVSKVLQNLANGITVFKEPYLEFLNEFMADNIGVFNTFLDKICELSGEIDLRKIEYKGGSNPNQALIAIHKYLKNNIHKVGSIISTFGTEQKKSTGLISGLEKSGWIKKLGGNVKTWKRRWFVLKNGNLFYFKGPQDPNSTGIIPLNAQVQIIESVENNTQFTIISELRNFLLQTETEAEKKDWLRSLRISLNDMKEKIEQKEEMVITSTIKRESSSIGDEINGYLLKAGPDGKNYQKRWFVLNKSLLLYFKNTNDTTPTGEIPLADCRTRKGEGNCFEIENEKTKRVYYLQASNKKDQEFWLNELKKAKARHFKTAPLFPEVTKEKIWSIESKETDKEGFLEKKGGNFKNWKKRWFVLKGQSLLYYKTTSSPEPIGVIDLSNCTIMDGGNNSFQILTNSRNWMLRTSESRQTQDWINALKNAAFKSEIEKVDPEPQKNNENNANNDEVVEQGYLQKQGGKFKTWRRRWFVLRSNTLSYFKNPGDVLAAGVIPLGKNVSVAIAEDKLEKKFVFEVFTRTRNFFLQAKDEYEMAKWMKSIEKVSATYTGPKNELMDIFFRLNIVLSEWEGTLK